MTNLFTTDSDATQQEQEAKRNLLASLVTGIAAAVGQDPSSALTSASIAIENNWLATEQKAQARRELEACGNAFTCKVLTGLKWTGVSAKQDALFGAGFIEGIGDAGRKYWKGLLNLGHTRSRL